MKLADLELEERVRREIVKSNDEARMTFQTLLDQFLTDGDSNPQLKPRTRQYWRERAAALMNSWPPLATSEARKITEADCESWAARFGATAAASTLNNTIGLLRRVLDRAVDQGLRDTNPAAKLKRARIRPKRMQLPTQAQFSALVQEIRRVPLGPGLASAELVQFLAFGGFRKGEAAAIRWNDADFQRMEITVRGDPETGTKNWNIRRVPMIPDMIAFLQSLQKQRPVAQPEDLVMRVRECQGALTRACKAIGIGRITHHDLRHPLH